VNLDYIRACTPSFSNSEGDLGDLPKSPFGTAYGGGLFEYFSILKEWRTSGILNDLEFTHEVLRTGA
jgi:hypothetical protein